MEKQKYLKYLCELPKNNKNFYSEKSNWIHQIRIDVEKLYCSHQNKQVRLNFAEMELLLILIVSNPENIPINSQTLSNKIIDYRSKLNCNSEYLFDPRYIRKIKKNLNIKFKNYTNYEKDVIESNNLGYWLSTNPVDFKILHY